MSDEYYVGAYWLARGESAESCARRAMEFFRLLARCDAAFSRWFRLGKTPEQASKHRVGLDLPSLITDLRRGQAFSVEGNFNLGVWNGEDNEAGISLNMSCGWDSTRVSNAIVLMLAAPGPTAERLLCPPVLTQVLRATVQAWEPEWALVTSSEHRDRLSEDGKVGTFVGWLTFISRSRGEVPPLPPPSQVEALGDKGSLVLLTPERLSGDNPAHIALAQQVAERLGQAGVLGPLRPPRP